MSMIVETENKARICRITAGWKKPHLPLDVVRRYWRDVHSPSIARREGIWDYRHFQYDPVRADLFAPVPGIVTTCPDDQQLMWTSDVRYADDEALARFSASPPPEIRAHILGDIDLIVDQSTTYKACDDDAQTLVDNTGDPTPQGLPARPCFQIFLRQKGEDRVAFDSAMRGMAAAWAKAPGVLRVRLSLLEAPDMEAERKAGYPIKTHPPERQYQAWIDLVVDSEAAAAPLLGLDVEAAALIGTAHAYPVTTLCTFNYAGRPTFSGLRGFPAYDALKSLGGFHQAEAGLLQWMYGPVAEGVTLDQPA
jgi:hypothetical protein